MSILRSIKRLLDQTWFDLLRGILPPGKPRNVILLVRTDGIGDFVFFLRYLQALIEHFKDYRFVLVCRKETADLARGVLPDNTVISFRYKAYRWNYLYRLFILAAIRSTKPSMAVYCSYHRQHIGDEMTLLSGASETIAFDGNDECIHPSMRRRNERYFSRIVVVEDHTPEKGKYAQLLRTLGVNPAGADHEPDLRASGFRESPPRMHKNYAVVAPGATLLLKRWPAERYKQLVGELIKRGYDVVLLGDRKDIPILRQVKLEGVNLCVDLPWDDVVGILRNASCFVGNDSGLLHLAGALKIPAIGIVYGGHFKRYFPYGRIRVVSHTLPCFECNGRCFFAEPYCLTWVQLGEVMKEVDEVLAVHPGAESPRQ